MLLIKILIIVLYAAIGMRIGYIIGEARKKRMVVWVGDDWGRGGGDVDEGMAGRERL